MARDQGGGGKIKVPAVKKVTIPKATGLGIAGAGGANKTGGVGPAKVLAPAQPVKPVEREKTPSTPAALVAPAAASLQIQNMTPAQYESWRAQTNATFTANANAAIAAQLTDARGGRTEAEYKQYLDTINTNYILGNTSPALQQQALDKYVPGAAAPVAPAAPAAPAAPVTMGVAGTGAASGLPAPLPMAQQYGVAGATTAGTAAGTGQYAPPKSVVSPTALGVAGASTQGQLAGTGQYSPPTLSERYGVAGATIGGVTAGTGQYAPTGSNVTQATQMVMPQGNYNLADLQGIAGVGADYAATYRYLQEAQAGRYMGLLTPNMIQLLGLTPADLLSMGYGGLSNGSYIRYDPTGAGTGTGGAPASTGGGGGGGGGGSYGGMSRADSGYAGSALTNWRIGV